MKKYIESFSQLRALAALLVVISHIPVTNRLVGNAIGGFAVCIFFMLSGFFLVNSIDKKDSSYFIRRFIRLVPMYYVFTIFTFFILTIKPSWFNTVEGGIVNLAKSLLFIPYENTNGVVRPVLDVGWAIMPEVWIVIIYYLVNKIFSKNIKYILLSIIIMLSFTMYICKDINNICNQYWTSFLYISIGMVFNILINIKYLEVTINKKNIVNIYFVNVLLFFVFGVLYSQLMIRDQYIYAYIIPVICYIYFYFINNYFIINKYTILLANSSYSLFLSHEFVIKGIDRLIYPINTLTFLSGIVIIISLIISVIISYLIYTYIEKVLTGFFIMKFLKGEICNERRKNIDNITSI